MNLHNHIRGEEEEEEGWMQAKGGRGGQGKATDSADISGKATLAKSVA